MIIESAIASTVIITLIGVILLNTRWGDNPQTKKKSAARASLMIGMWLVIFGLFVLLPGETGYKSLETFSGTVYEVGKDGVEYINDVSTKSHPNRYEIDYEDGNPIYVMYQNAKKVMRLDGTFKEYAR